MIPIEPITIKRLLWDKTMALLEREIGAELFGRVKQCIAIESVPPAGECGNALLSAIRMGHMTVDEVSLIGDALERIQQAMPHPQPKAVTKRRENNRLARKQRKAGRR